MRNILFILLLICANAGAANIFEWDGESSSCPTGYEPKGGGVLVLGDTTSPPTGLTASMKQVMEGTQQDIGCKELNGAAWGLSFGASYYHRFWIRISTDIAYSNQDKTKVNRWTNVLTGYFYETGVAPGEHNDGFSSAQGAGSGGEGPLISYDFNPNSNTLLQSWTEVIVLFRIQSAADTCDGTMQLWVNAASQGALTSVCWFSGSGPSPLNELWGPFMMTQFPQDISGTWWLAYFSVDTTFNSIWSAPPSTVFMPVMQ